MFRVILSSGELCYSAVDFSLAWLLPINFERRYRGFNAYSGSLGRGWTHTFDTFAQLSSDRLTFCFDGLSSDSVPLAELGPDGTHNGPLGLVSVAPHLITLARSGFTYAFLNAGVSRRCPLIRLKGVPGDELAFEYDSALQLKSAYDTFGRILHFVHTVDGLLRQVDLEIPGQRREAISSYNYDRRGRLTTVNDRLGRAARYEYDGNSLVSYTNPKGGFFFAEHFADSRCARTWRSDGRLSRQFRYDLKRHITSMTDSLGRETLYYFREDGGLLRRVDCEANRTTLAYDPAGNLMATIGPDGSGPLSIYDSTRDELSYIKPGGGHYRISFSRSHAAYTIEDGGGQRWRYDFTSDGLPLRKLTPVGAEWKYLYDEHGILVRAVDPFGHAVQYRYAPGYSSVEVDDELGPVSRAAYSPTGEMMAFRLPLENPTRYEYDAAGRLTAIHNPAGGETRFSWDDNDNLAGVSLPSGVQRRYEFNEFSELVRQEYAPGRGVAYEFDTECRLAAIRNESGEEMRFEYDSLGRLIRQDFFDKSWEAYRYDTNDSVRRIANSAGEETALTYNADGRVNVVRDHLGSEARYSYDGNGNLLKAESAAGAVARVYDADGRLVREKSDIGSLELEYDLGGNIVAARASCGVDLRYEYDHRGRLARIDSKGVPRLRFEYDLMNRPFRTEIVGTSLVNERQYHPYGRLKSNILRGAGVLLTKEYDYDSSGRLIRVLDERGATEYVYTDADQVAVVRRNGQVMESYQYDARGNMIYSSGHGAVTYDSGGRIRQAFDRVFEHDGSGCIVGWIRPGENAALLYDGSKRLIEFRSEKGVTRFQTDAIGRRIRKWNAEGEIRYLWFHNWLLAEIYPGEAAGIVYLKPPSEWSPVAIESEGILLFLFGDHLSRPTHAIDERGALVWACQYDLLGHAAEETGDFRLTPRLPGQYLDYETGLTFNNARYYDSELGRFLTPDPVGLNGGSLNLYQYAPNPLNFIDPLGLAVTTVQCSSYCSSTPAPNPPCAPRQPNSARPPRDRKTTNCPAGNHDSIHNLCINKVWNSKTATVDADARRDQRQVIGGTGGTSVGLNRPDIQFTPPGGPPTFVEFDNYPYSRQPEHLADICGNQPNAVVDLVQIPRGMTKQSLATAGHPTDAECGL
jgi:RHS repeat-associated protein